MVFDSKEFNGRLFFPRADVSKTPPGAIDLEVAVPSASLQMRVHRSSESTRAPILLFHGNGEVVADYDDAAPAFARAGASLALVDFRGYGASTGEPTLRSTITDAPLVLARLVAEVHAQHDRDKARPIIVMGRSLGSACAAELYGARPPDVAGFILESGASDILGLVRRRGLAVPSEIDPSDRALFDPIPKLGRGNHRLLVLHGAEDELILPVEGERAFEASGASSEDKKLVIIPKHGHNNISWAPAYWTAIADFIRSLT